MKQQEEIQIIFAFHCHNTAEYLPIIQRFRPA